jgi:hypothetical protein
MASAAVRDSLVSGVFDPTDTTPPPHNAKKWAKPTFGNSIVYRAW